VTATGVFGSGLIALTDNLFLTQLDVRHVQIAKVAVLCGILKLMKGESRADRFVGTSSRA
jgi:hypothetical protein